MGGRTGGDTTQTTTAEPPAWHTPYIQDVLNQSQGQFQAGGAQYFPDSTVAGFNPIQYLGFGQSLNAADAMNPQLGNMNNALAFQLTQAANPLTNPFFHGTAQAMIRPASQTLTREVLPQIDQGSVVSGNYGGSRQGLAQANAINDWQQNVLDTLNQFGTNAYDIGLRTQTGAMALAPGLIQANLMPSQVYGDVGDRFQTQEQLGINADIDRWNYWQNLPQQNLQNYANFVFGSPSGTYGSSIMEAPQSSPLLSMIGGGLAGGSLGAAIPGFGAGPGSLLGPAGWAGLALGAGLGLFG